MKRRAERIGAQSVTRIMTAPATLAIASLVGLVLGLTGEGWRDGLSAILVFLPLAVFARHWLRRG